MAVYNLYGHLLVLVIYIWKYAHKKGIAIAVILDAGINVIDVWVENNVPMLIIE